jgi:hypothetical protein
MGGIGCGLIEFVNHFRDLPSREKLLEAFERAFGNRANPILRRKRREVPDETRVEHGLWLCAFLFLF